MNYFLRTIQKNILLTRILLSLVVEPALHNHEHVVYTDT